MRSSARIWRNIAQMDQYENMKRNQQVQRAYKMKLVDDLLKKEQKYFRTKQLKQAGTKAHLGIAAYLPLKQ